MKSRPRYPGIRVTANGNQLVSYHTETRIADAGVFYPITPSTEGGELYQQAFAEGKLNVFGQQHASRSRPKANTPRRAARSRTRCAASGSSTTRPGQGVVYGVEQYYHAPGKCSTMVLEVAARALTKHALNVHCGHDDVYGALDTGWIIVFGKDAQQAADQALILRRVTELSLTPGMNVMDGFLTSHLERTFYKHEVGADSPVPRARPRTSSTVRRESQRVLFGPKRRRVPQMIDLTNPVLLGPVQNQEHYMQGVVARRNNFVEPILEFFEDAYRDFAELTGPRLRSGQPVQDRGCGHGVRVAGIGGGKHRSGGRLHARALGRRRSARSTRTCSARSRMRPSSRRWRARRTSSSSSGPTSRWRATTRWDATSGRRCTRRCSARAGCRRSRPTRCRGCSAASTASGSRDFRPEHTLGAYEFAVGKRARKDGKARRRRRLVLRARHRSPLRGEVRRDAVAAARRRDRRPVPLRRRLGRDHDRQEPRRDHRRPERSALRPRQGRRRVRQSRRRSSTSARTPSTDRKRRGRRPSYFMVAAPERIRVNCDLRHVTVVLCCDPKAFTHCNPLDGMAEGGCLIWESDEDGRAGVGAAAVVGPPADHREEDPRLHAARDSRSPARRPTAATCSCACRATRSSARSSPCRRCSTNSASRRSSSTRSCTSST